VLVVRLPAGMLVVASMRQITVLHAVDHELDQLGRHGRDAEDQ